MPDRDPSPGTIEQAQIAALAEVVHAAIKHLLPAERAERERLLSAIRSTALDRINRPRHDRHLAAATRIIMDATPSP